MVLFGNDSSRLLLDGYTAYDGSEYDGGGFLQICNEKNVMNNKIDIKKIAPLLTVNDIRYLVNYLNSMFPVNKKPTKKKK